MHMQKYMLNSLVENDAKPTVPIPNPLGFWAAIPTRKSLDFFLTKSKKNREKMFWMLGFKGTCGWLTTFFWFMMVLSKPITFFYWRDYPETKICDMPTLDWSWAIHETKNPIQHFFLDDGVQKSILAHLLVFTSFL